MPNRKRKRRNTDPKAREELIDRLALEAELRVRRDRIAFLRGRGAEEAEARRARERRLESERSERARKLREIDEITGTALTPENQAVQNPHAAQDIYILPPQKGGK